MSIWKMKFKRCLNFGFNTSDNQFKTTLIRLYLYLSFIGYCFGNVTCPEDQFMCNDGQRCIPIRWKCDLSPDCLDSSDEPQDCPVRTCISGQFQCESTKQCIPMGWVCDGEPDCGLTENLVPDTSDEDSRRCHRGNACQRNYFRCKDGITCRKLSLLCDGNNDCPDMSDESDFCANKTSCDGLGCSHGCKPTIKGPICYCNEGKEPNGTECIDANECHVEGVCDQICINTADSHECQCVDGYKKNGSQCIAINEPEDLIPTIIFANSINVQQLYLNGSTTSINSSVTVRETLALDFSHRNRTACWISHDEKQALMECAFVDNLLEKWILPRTHLFQLSTVNQMAFDWIANNWYFLDDAKETIFMCNETLAVCIVVIDVELSKPRAIALDPTKGYLFFTEWGSTAPLLERSRLDGSDRTRLVDHKIVYPYGITIDFPNEHVYWVDTYLDFIERINYNGSGRHTIIRGLPVRNLYGITLFEQYLYVTSWHSNSIISVNKFNHSDIRTLQSNLTRPFSIHVYHRQRQPIVEHPCALNNGGCDHICITHYTGKTRKPVAMCRCLAGHRLVRGGQCVIAKQSQFLLYARGRPGTIKGMTMGVTGKKEEAMVPITSLSRPTALDFDARSQFIYYSDVQRFVIERQTINGSKREVFLDKGLNNCEGLAIDWMGRNLYWTDEGLLSLFVARLDNSEIKKRLVHGNMSHPRAIVVDPKRGYMYWSDWSTEPRSESDPQLGGKIERAYMNGNGREVFVSSNLQWPNGLSLDYTEKKLYWCDAYLHRIERIDLDGLNRETLFEGERLGHPYGLVFFEGYLFWTEFQDGIVQRLNIKTKEFVELVTENPPLFEIRLFDDSSQNGINDCTNNNNGCEDLCLSTPTHTVCSCRDGYTLSANKTFCEVAANYTEPSRCKEGEFECVKNLRCIDVRYLCDGDNDCADGSDEDTSSGAICAQVTCRTDHIRCDTNRCISIHWICDGEKDCLDGTDEEPLHKCRNATCSASQFTCKVSGRCIPASWTCDSDHDCGEGDNSDEHDQCAYPECEAMEFRCKNQRCVPLEYVCDGDDDCRDSSDEINCNLSCNTTTQFTCDAGQKCLHTAYKCNGVWDCNDGTDEENCFSSTFNKTSINSIACHKDEFNCKSGGCVHQSWQCDGKKDCLDGSDEKSCNSTNPCQSNQFRCKSSGHCIPLNRKCDSHTDCEDKSDESDCPKDLKSETHVSCFAPNRTCIGKQNETICLEISRFCDNRVDCLNSTDEGGLCDEDNCFFSDCKGSCHNIPNFPGYTCLCNNGLTLAADGLTCTDSSPCERWGACSQKCVQLKHSHKCECESGYMLESDGFTCKSTDPATPYVIFSNRHEIRSVDLHTMSVKPLLSGLKNTIALDFYNSPEESMIFWTDVMDDKIYRGFIIHGSLTNIEVIVQIGLATAEGLAVDWIAHNIYWVESNLDQIEVAKLNGSFRRTLIAGQMVSPRAIALDCRFGILFWTDWDSDAPRIESASMSGDDRKLVYKVDVSEGAWPNGLALDYVALRVYWIDARSDSINTVKYDGTGYHEVLRGHELLTHPFAISLYGNHVYWTDWRTNSVIRANKWNGTDVKVIQRAITQPFDIKILHPSRQPTDNITSLCTTNNGGCSHLCLINKNNTYRCKCPHIMKLDTDNKTCLPNEKVLLISRPNEIRGVDLENPYYHTIPPINLPKVISAGQIDYIAKEKQIYWADSQLNEVKRALLTGSPVETIIDTVIEHPYGFALDWISRNIFVTSQEPANRAKIYVCNLNGEFITDIIREGIYAPRSLAVHPFDGLIIWADHGFEDVDDNGKNKDAVISQASMDGTSIQPLVQKKDNKYLDQPSSLAIDFESTPNRLYWVNIGSASIQFIDLGSNEIITIWDEGRNPHLPLEPLALTVYHNSLLFSSQTDNSIHLIDKTDGKNHSIFRNQTEDVLTIKVYDSSLQSGTNLCEKNNGNCSHLCLMVSKSKRVCKCTIGFQIDKQNDTNCLGPEVFLMYSWNWGIRGTSSKPNATTEPMLPPISRVLMASSIDYVYKEGYIYWVDNDEGSVTRIKRDTTNHQIIVNGVEKIEGFAVDWMANNVYWIDPDYDVIEVAHLNGSCRYVILSGNMDKPNSLAVHPLQGFLFWSDIGLTPRIERALLDGSERVVITNSSIHMINDLAIDVLQDKIYWCDSQSDTIERMNLDGTDREIIISGGIIESPISITVFEHYIYWADTNYLGGAILRADKDNANSTVDIIQSQMGDHIKDIKVFHKRPTSIMNKCGVDNGGCQQLCLYRGPSQGHRCACAHGRISAIDNKTCEPYEAFIMYSRVTEIDSIHIYDEQSLNAPYPSITNRDHMRNVIGLTFDYYSQRVIYSDIQRGSISSSFFNGTGHKLLVEKQGSVEGIVYDPMYGELYWTSNSDASISRLNLRLDGSKIEKIIKLGLEDKPRGIAVDSCASRVYWTNWNNRSPSIQRAYLSGYDLHPIVTSDIRMPNAITIDHKLQKLYWSDARLDKIEKCNLDGTERYLLLTETPKHPFDLAILGDYLFWTDWVEHAVLRCNKFTGSEVVKLRRNVPRPMGIIAVSNDTEDCTLNPCLPLNGGCEDVCSVASNGTIICSCFIGRVLSSDAKTCVIKNSNCSDTEYECGTGVCIPFELTCDGVSSCPDDSDENTNYCATRECPIGFFRCSDNRCILESKHCDGQIHCSDGSDESDCLCSDDKFKCKDGPCIGKQFRCDSDPDCSDGSDEIGCDRPDCSKHPLFWDPEQKFINCPSTTACIHPDWICDGQNDCWDHSDEANCKTKSLETSCPPNSFKCLTAQCIPMAWVCDRDNDCDDKNMTVSSDEETCVYGCQSDQFKCNNSDCIPTIWRCDGHQDCSDGSDETEDCRTRTCPEDWFRCNNTGQCIPAIWVCDGENDCGDQHASDEHPEQGCNASICKPNEFQCLNFQCILQSFWCDGDDDCGDKSDEPENCSFAKCQKDQFECRNKKCISKTWLCNGIADCHDGEDEANGLCIHNMTTSKCIDGKYECENEICIEADLLCDGNDDCGDYSDESKCNVNECESGFVCAQKCEDMPIGYKCSCFEGFEPLDGGRVCKDVDECKSKRPCSQHCRNTYGSYVCSCEKGYYSIDGGISCKANSSIHTTIIFSNRYYIRQINVKGHDSKLIVRNLTNAVALDFDWAERCIYWSDVTALGSSIKRLCEINLNQNQTSTEQILHSATVQSPDGIAVDWIGRNLYWCDKGKDTIEVSKLDGKFRKILIKDGLEEPRAIVLNPYEGYLFWTDWGETPYIGKAGMDGSQFTVIINESLGWPNALTIDYVNKELFYADAREDYIAVTDLNGKNRQVVISRKTSNLVHHIFALTVFENTLYWSDWETKGIEYCHKYHCTNVSTLTTTAHRPMDLHIYHPYRQLPLQTPNPCEDERCSTLCLLKPNGGSVCACPENYLLQNDSISCENNCTSSQFVCQTTFNCIPFWWKCDTQDDCGDGSDEPKSCPKFHCSPGQFQCQNTHCIPPSQLCDGRSQCGDNSDERECDKYTCLPSQFKCLSNGTVQSHCISAISRCDGINDCIGNEDELNCPEKNCMNNQFKCSNNRCIPQVWQCDGDDDCGDNSDEPLSCKSRVCSANYFKCETGRCIPMSWKCDGDSDCVGQEDEPSSCKDKSSTCNENYFKCNNNKCIPGRWHCDFEDDCGDNSDEVNCTPRECSEEEFRCSNGRCIRSLWRCNGEYNCEDKSDEINCNVTCNPKEFHCHDSNFCILNDWKCDGDADCPDSSDEKNCGHTCMASEFLCDNGQCVSALWRCDGEDDCGDNSDEELSRCSTIACPPGRFRCKNNICISNEKVCDGRDSCGDESDEDSVFCSRHKHCSPQQFQCSNNHCINSENVCDGNDDCTDNSDEENCDLSVCHFGTCSQLCLTKKGSNHSCTCTNGYSKSISDNKSCIALGEPAVLLVASENGLRKVNPYKSSVQELIDILSNVSKASRIDSFDVMYETDKVTLFWTSFHTRSVYRFDAPMIDDKKEDKKGDKRENKIEKRDTVQSSSQPIPIASGLIASRGIAIDWIGKNLYFIDAGAATITISTIDGSVQRTLISNDLDQPHDIVVDPKSGFIFWTDWGRNPKIERSRLDGSMRKALVERNLEWPTGLAIDYAANRIYWTDPKAATIETIDIDGKYRHVVKSFNKSEEKPYKIEVFEDYIYVSTFHNNAIFRMNKFGGNITYLVRGLNKASDVVIVQENKQNRLIDNPCLTKHCGEGALCVAQTNLKPICLCSNDMIETPVGEDGGSVVCTPNDSPTANKCDLECLNGGTCYYESDDTPKCLCPPGFDGPLCDRYRCSGYCKNKGHCYPDLLTNSNNPNHPPLRCECPPDWIGERCETPVHICDNFCLNGGTCRVEYGVPQCVCLSDFFGQKCQNCHSLKCENSGHCRKNADQSYTCHCPPGFSGERCHESLCDNYCEGGNCTIIAGVPQCACFAGYSGKKCAQDSCKETCLNGGTCQRNAKKAMCVCPVGYQGKRCEQNLCGCRNGGTCILTKSEQGHNTCLCRHNFMGAFCERFIAKSCEEVTCHNGGNCVVNEKHEPYCKCAIGWTGPLCDIETSPICNSFCLHGGTCSVPDAREMNPKCTCFKGWVGSRCQININCKGFCFNGATCVPLDNSDQLPTCLCVNGFTGLRCESLLLRATELESNSDSFDNTTKWILVTVIPLAIILILFLAIFIGIFMYRIRKSNRAFMHRRMQESVANVEISNPMFGGEDFDDDSSPSDALSRSFSIEVIEKSTNFTNPMYEYQKNSEEEKRTLLISDNEINTSEDSNEVLYKGLHPLA